MKLTLSVLFVAFSVSSAFAVCPALNLPQRFNLEEKKRDNDGRDFRIQVDGEKVAQISMRRPLERFDFELRDDRKDLIARGIEKRKGAELRLEIVDCENRLIGLVEARTLRNSFHFDKEYKIFDANDRHVGTAVKSSLIATQYNINTASGIRSVEINLPALDLFNDSWKVTVLSNDIDPRIALMFPVYKSSTDVRKSVLDRIEDRKEREERKRNQEEERREAEEKQERLEKKQQEKR